MARTTKRVQTSPCAKRSKGPTRQEWEAHRLTLERLYNQMSQAKIKYHMQKEHKFKATASQYETYFNKLGLRKYADATIWKAIAPRVNALRKEGKGFEVRIHGKKKPIKVVLRRISQYFVGHNLGSIPPLPASVVVRPLTTLQVCEKVSSSPTVELPFQYFERHLYRLSKISPMSKGASAFADAIIDESDGSDLYGGKQVARGLQAMVPYSKSSTSDSENKCSGTLVPCFKSPLQRSVLCSIANNFAGLESVPKKMVFQYLRHQTSDEMLKLILSNGNLHTTQAITLILFKATIEGDEGEVLDLLLSNQRLRVLVDQEISVNGRKYLPLQLAASLGHTFVMNVLLRHGANPLVRTDPHPPGAPSAGILDLYISANFDRTRHDMDSRMISELLNRGVCSNGRSVDSLVSFRVRHLLPRILQSFDSQAWTESNKEGTLLWLFKDLETNTLSRLLHVLIASEVDLNHCPQLSAWGPAVLVDVVAERGDVQLLRELSAAGARLTTDTLSFAVSSQVIDAVVFVLGVMQDTKGVSRRDLTPLGASIKANNGDIIDLITSNELAMAVERRSGFKSAFIEAVKSENIAWIKRIMQTYGPIDSAILGLALRFAIHGRDREISSMLISNGVDVNNFEEGARPPLYHALCERDYVLVRRLLDEEADANYHGFEGIDTYVSTAIVKAVDSGDMRLVDMVLAAGSHREPSSSANWSNPLVKAIEKRDEGMFKHLIKAGFDVNDKSALFPQDTVLHAAVETRDARLVRMVMEHGADPNDTAALLNALWPSQDLQWSCRRNPEIVELLLANRSRHQNRRPWGGVILWCTIYNNDFELFRRISKLGGDPGQIRDAYLHWECLYSGDDNWDKSYDDDYEVRDQFELEIASLTPFGFAILASSNYKIGPEYAEYLLQNNHTIGDCHPETIVADNTYHGADAPVSRRTAFLVAIETGHLPTVNMLLGRGANVNYPAELGVKRTPLQQAAEDGVIEIVQLLLDREADVNAPPATRGGGTALQLAALKGNCPVVRLLLDHGADVNAVGSRVNGRTALEAAAEHGRLDVAQLLLQHIASKGHDTADQIASATNFAQRNGYPYIVEMLRAFARDGVTGLQQEEVLPTNDEIDAAERRGEAVSEDSEVDDDANMSGPVNESNDPARSPDYDAFFNFEAMHGSPY